MSALNVFPSLSLHVYGASYFSLLVSLVRRRPGDSIDSVASNAGDLRANVAFRARNSARSHEHVHSLFPSQRWSLVTSPSSCGVSLRARVRCPRSFSSHLEQDCPSLSPPLSLASEPWTARARAPFFRHSWRTSADVRQRLRLEQVSDAARLIERSPVPADRSSRRSDRRGALLSIERRGNRCDTLMSS